MAPTGLAILLGAGPVVVSFPFADDNEKYLRLPLLHPPSFPTPWKALKRVQKKNNKK